MKFFRKWLKPDPKQQSTAHDRVAPGWETEGEHSKDSSLSWFEIDQADSSIFDTGKLVTEKSEDKNPVSHSTLRLEDDPLCSTKEDIGVDPYNTGSFDTEK